MPAKSGAQHKRTQYRAQEVFMSSQKKHSKLQDLSEVVRAFHRLLDLLDNNRQYTGEPHRAPCSRKLVAINRGA